MKEIKLIVNYNGNFAGEIVSVPESAATELVDMGFAQGVEPEATPKTEPENKAIQPEYKSRKPKK